MSDALAIAPLCQSTQLQEHVPRSVGVRRSCSDEQLLEALAEGQKWPLEVVYERYAERLYTFAHARIRNGPATDDLVQDLFVSLLVRHRILKVRSLKAYLFKAAYYSARRCHHATRARMVTHESLTDQSGVAAKESSAPDARVDALQLEAAFGRAKAALPERCRAAYELVRDCGLTYAEAAEALGISQKAVELRMGRALRALRQALAAWL